MCFIVTLFMMEVLVWALPLSLFWFSRYNFKERKKRINNWKLREKIKHGKRELQPHSPTTAYLLCSCSSLCSSPHSYCILSWKNSTSPSKFHHCMKNRLTRLPRHPQTQDPTALPYEGPFKPGTPTHLVHLFLNPCSKRKNEVQDLRPITQARANVWKCLWWIATREYYHKTDVKTYTRHFNLYSAFIMSIKSKHAKFERCGYNMSFEILRKKDEMRNEMRYEFQTQSRSVFSTTTHKPQPQK